MQPSSIFNDLVSLIFFATVAIGSVYLAGTGGYTVNEIRAAVGAPAIDGGDELNLIGHALNTLHAEVTK